MPGAAGFHLDWHAGASAQVEIFSPGPVSGTVYKLKYTPPMRATIRPPVMNMPLGPGELGPVDDQLDVVVKALNVGDDLRGGKGTAAEVTQNTIETTGELQLLGNLLLNSIFPGYIQAELRPPGLFLEIGMDEALLKYPWELIHDGEEFFCLKHSIGRFVNSSEPTPLQAYAVDWWGEPLEDLSLLLIVVPSPEKRPGFDFPPLHQAENEANAIAEAMTAKSLGINLDILRGRDATFTAVFQKLRDNRYHIVHFCGHAEFNDQEPRKSRLMLFDKPMTTGLIVNFISKTRPILCFINACDSAMAHAGRDRFNVFGLARAFLETGAYLLGSRWKVCDAAAAAFAKAFYTSLLVKGKPMGLAVRDARSVCRANAPDDFAWASYVLYGDPRVCFVTLQTTTQRRKKRR